MSINKHQFDDSISYTDFMFKSFAEFKLAAPNWQSMNCLPQLKIQNTFRGLKGISYIFPVPCIAIAIAHTNKFKNFLP